MKKVIAMNGREEQMDDLISRETMKDVIDITTWYHQNRNGVMVEGAHGVEDAWFKAEDVFKAIENVPSALALEQERKKGKWIIHIQRGNWNDEEIRTCPNCGKTFRNLDIANYCPNCGLPMEVGNDE